MILNLDSVAHRLNGAGYGMPKYQTIANLMINLTSISLDAYQNELSVAVRCVYFDLSIEQTLVIVFRAQSDSVNVASSVNSFTAVSYSEC